MNAIKLAFPLWVLCATACGDDEKQSKDTGFDLGVSDDGASDTDVDATDDENAPPEVTISSPSNGDVLQAGTELTFFAVVNDDTDDASLLELEWSSDRQGELGTSPADTTGAASVTVSGLEGGTHIIILTATDREGSSSSDSVTIRVDGDVTDDEVLEDIDEDGFTVEEGDCNDENPDTYPGAEEICDGAGEDNNCDGEEDSEYEDEYESNENMGTAYDLGEIDENWFSWGTASLTVTDLTLDGPDDEDWFQWFADDDPGDHPDIAIHVDADPDMYLIVELYVADWDTTTPMAATEGFGDITIDESDFEFESEFWWADFAWDNIFVRVKTNDESWTPDICETETYDLTIES